ncbi:lisH dimerization motif containing protein [Rhodotorula toruloides]|uniref:LisH dimerization motif containing protein n=1 Tax=Rhodotorula toruloides TaxID=5286 RepID=A0A511KAU1_RHOTO|nr:lisH dimerization motif containing protein [Rhodotorula toruloides]
MTNRSANEQPDPQPRPQSAGPSSFAWEGDATLHSWWSVFWDVFIARSQKSGAQNPHAVAYVDAMRAKRDPLVVQFAGANPSPAMTLPRSLAHPPRNSTSMHQPQAGPSGPPRTTYSQMHVLEQQELQAQMQQQRGRLPQLQTAGPGNQRLVAAHQAQPGQPAIGYVNGSQAPMSQQYAMHSAPLQQQPHGGSGVPGPLMQPPQNQSFLPQHQQQQQNQLPQPPPSSNHCSPRLMPAQANGRAGMQTGASAFQTAMSAVGLTGRDPESLSAEEHNAVAAQMRRMGALPPSSSSAQGMMRPGQQGQQGQQQVRMVQHGRPQPERQLSAQLYQQQQQQQPFQQQQQQRIPQNPYGAPGGAGPASPAYSAPSPYSTPHVSHMQIPPQQQQQQQNPNQYAPSHSSPQGEFTAPLPPGRGGAQKNRPPTGGAQGQKMPTGLTKRAGVNMEEPSPRNRKRARGATGGEHDPGTPSGGFDPSTGSPAPMMGMQASQQGGQMFGQDGVPYRPSPSPSLMQPPKPPQQMVVTGPSPQPQHYGDAMNGAGTDSGGGQGYPVNGVSPGANGSLSRPASAASNHHYLSPGHNGAPQQQQLGLGPPPGPDQRRSPISPSAHDAGGPRPFAGAPSASSASSTPLAPLPPPLGPEPNGIPVGPPSGQTNANDSSFQFNLGEDVFTGLDFDSFLNNDMFSEETVG